MISFRTGLKVIKNNLLIRNQRNVVSIMFKRDTSTHLTKNITLITDGDDKRKISVDKTNLKLTINSNDDSDNYNKPLVVLLTWLLAKHKHVNKFNRIYLEQGFDVLNVSVAPWQILWPAKGTQVVARDVLKFLENNHSYSPLLLHGFSVGGYVWGEALAQIVQDQTRYQTIVDRIYGQIWDSAADITEIPVGMPKAVFPKNQMLENALRQYILYHMSAFHKLATCHYIRASQVFHTSVIRAPALFLLSKSDPVGSYASNMKVKEDWEAIGIKVYWKCWDKSPHVSHFYYHPKEYALELYQFLGKLDLLSYPEKMQIQAKL